VACGRELVELGDRVGEEVLSYVGCQQLAWCHRELGDVDAMARWLADAARRMTAPTSSSSPSTRARCSWPALAGADAITRRMKDVTPSTTVTWGYVAPLRLVLDELRGGGPRRAQLESMAAEREGIRRLTWEAALGRQLARTGLHTRAPARCPPPRPTAGSSRGTRRTDRR